ncbi:NAD(P)/FAD-dependent oxidoreductase [Nocardioides fonticola]|uniref:NAD(P)/FAD-dependent oxidoreductase n=1 Tax=Nocardioides fonticola TaxID=450363 RepID=A0ABP7XHT5_9ACTN
MRNPHAGVPFTAAEVPDDVLARHLADLSAPALLATCVHLLPSHRRGEILDGDLRPAGVFLNEYQGFMPPEQQDAVRALALDLVTAWRDAGCPEPEPLSPADLHRLMDLVTGEAVAEEYVPLLAEEMDLEGVDPRRPAPLPGAAELPTVIIGCGLSGVLAAIRLQQAGVPFTIVEKNPGPGGTWFENTYPGARVDVGNHFYCYSFEPADHWSEYFAQAPELRAYVEQVMTRHGLGAHVRYGVEALGADWDDDAGTWTVHLDDGTTLLGRALICAVGQMNRPLVPEVPGSFDGPAFHTARWRHDVDLTDRDVVLVGAGATGFQLAPAIADQVRSLTIVQRTAQWMFPNPGYHDRVGPGVGWAIRHLPFYGRWFRFLILYPGCDTGLAAARVDPDWADQEHSVSETNDLVRQMFGDWIVSQCEGDADLIAKVLPTYPPTGKRTLQDNGSWLATLRRPHVELVRAGVAALDGDAVVTTDGARHRADVLVWATGFRTNDFLLPLRIRGRDGVDLRASWGDRPRAHLGVTVPGFPNLFLLYGPATNLASGGSIIFASECEVAHVLACLRLLADAGARTIEPTQAAYDDYYERTQAEVTQTVWASPHIEHNYYRDAGGRVHGLNPWRTLDWWSWTRVADPAEHVLR